MHIHCSACGAPLSPGTKTCPACALPLTAIAMPTPPLPRKRPVSILTIVFCCLGILWAVAYAADRHQIRSMNAAQIEPAPGIDQTLEQRMERGNWFSASHLRSWREEVAKDLAGLQHRPNAQQAVANDQAALQRIDARLQQLRAQ